MTLCKWINVRGKGPVAKGKSGMFEVSLWHWKRVTLPKGSHMDMQSERETDVHRASIRYSDWVDRDQCWRETVIWCNVEDLVRLVEAVEALHEDNPQEK